MVTGILAVATVLTGVVLPWDQLALRAVTINSSYRGYVDLLHGDSVRYVVIDNSEIGIGAFRMWFWGHAVLLPFVVAFLLLLTVRIVRRGGRLSGAENAP